MARYTRVEEVLNINDNRLWYRIDNYNGYEISNDGYLRSMKMHKDSPFGILIKPKNKKKNIYELSDDNNRRVQLTIDEIKIIASKSVQHSGYPRKTYQGDQCSRNDRHFIQKPPEIIRVESYSMPKFTVMKDEIPNNGCPIYNLTDGRSDYYVRNNSGELMYQLI